MTRSQIQSSAAIVLTLLVSGCFQSTSEVASGHKPTATPSAAEEAEAREQSDPKADHSEAIASNTSETRSEKESQASPEGELPGPGYDADTPVLPEGAGPEAVEEPLREPVKRMPPPENARQLDPQYDVWIDPERKSVIMDGFVSFREGPLEMFACTRGTKEHESVVSVNTKAFLVHAALLNVGAEPGTPVQFLPEFQPPTGTEIDINVRWVDEDGKQHTARAQDWVRDARTGKALEHPWVFAGSGFWKDDQTGISHYQAEGGDFICVSNFASAMLDIPVESTQANEGLAYEAFTERIPPLGTHVRLILTPQLTESDAPGESRPAEPRDDPQDDPARDLDG